jgi:hypothetical protein
MPRKLRNPKARFEQTSPTALWVLGDRKLYPEPINVDSWELMVSPSLDYPTVDFDKSKALWDSCKDHVLTDWIKRFPGTRPSYWWLFDAPRMSQAELVANGWNDCFFSHKLCEPRKRLSGIGIAAHEVECLVPTFSCGIPDDFGEVDPHKPPVFESQSSYLKRFNLFAPGEARQLKAKNFEPEIIHLGEEELPGLTGSVQ